MFNKWFRDRKKRIVPVEIVGRDEDLKPADKPDEKKVSAPPKGAQCMAETPMTAMCTFICPRINVSFGSHEGVESSAVYHTIIATCKAQAISVCEYLKKFFTACVNGRTDYERSSLSRLPLDLVAWLVQEPTGRKNLTPMMLCQPVK